MATFSITVNEGISKSNYPFVKSDDNDSCEQTMVITVPVPTGESRYVTLTHIGSGANSANDVTETINTTTDYTLLIAGDISDQENLNTEYATVTLNVSLTNTSSIFYSKQINRQHTGNFC